MTREEEIIEAGIEYTTQSSPRCISGGNFYEQTKGLNRNISFEEGAKWADENPKSPWISVKDDLPCNHEELLEAKCQTKEVFVIKALGFFDICYMQKINGKWIWLPYKSIEYWMPVPELPKE